MEHCTRKPGDEKANPEFSRDSIEQAMRLRIRDTIEELVKEELDAALGASKSARVGEQRKGYRHGTRERTLTTSLAGGQTTESNHTLLDRGMGRQIPVQTEGSGFRSNSPRH